MRPWRRRQKQPLRYYLYISDAKLDMLFSQIGESILKRISAEIKVDLKLAGVTLREREQPIASRTAKLRVVEQYITEYHPVGTIRDPGPEYFRGHMNMQWGWLRGYRWDEQNPPIVIFRGREESDFVALAGSRRHVLGEQPGDTSRNAEAFSALPNILAVVGEHISGSPEIGQTVRDLREHPQPSEESAALAGPPLDALNSFAVTNMPVPPEPLEFLAIRLTEGSMTETGFEGVHGVLGTPLYVARWRRP
jgi:uncharacterized protein DUF7019